MSLNIATFALFMVIAMTTYHVLCRAVEKRFGHTIAEDKLTQIMIIAIAITVPNALATVLLAITGFLLSR